MATSDQPVEDVEALLASSWHGLSVVTPVHGLSFNSRVLQGAALAYRSICASVALLAESRSLSQGSSIGQNTGRCGTGIRHRDATSARPFPSLRSAH